MLYYEPITEGNNTRQHVTVYLGGHSHYIGTVNLDTCTLRYREPVSLGTAVAELCTCDFRWDADQPALFDHTDQCKADFLQAVERTADMYLAHTFQTRLPV